MKIEEEIQQKQFADPYQKASINLLFTASWLHSKQVEYLRPFNISWQQFNILRILKGMSPEPASVKLLMERMIDKMSNASRLVEKLKQKGLVERHSCEMDRRRVEVSITEEGLRIVNAASKVLDTEMCQHQPRIPENEANQLSDLLDKFRY